MARKSRKNLEAALPDTQPAAKMWNVGAYVRLSAVDRKQKGDSIENQQAIIGAFVAEHPEMSLADTYIDNGTSGQTFDRPAFQRMLADLESGKINCCISKDLSRLGRNAIDTGFYIEKYFPTRGIRYIAINDDYDSADSHSGGIMVSLKNMMNETYALEIGRKIRTTKQMNIKNGAFVGSVVPYGYFKSESDKYKLVADPYSGGIVRQIFERCANGQTSSEIQDWLIADKVLPPRRYLFSKGMVSANMVGKQTRWNKGVIYSILRNRIYCGDMVQGKTSTREHVQYRLSDSEWVVTEDAHEAIVSRELFEKVQNLKQPKKRAAVNTVDNIFLRKIYCGHCGYALRRHRNTKTSTTFQCESRRYYGKDACVLVSVNEEMLKAELLELLRKQAAVFADIREQQGTNTAASNSQAELLQVRQELDRVSGFLKGLYESLVSGDITNSEYAEMKQNYEKRITALTDREKQLRNEIRERYLCETAIKKTSEKLDAVNCITDLTAEVIDALVEKILVFEDKHIEVRFRFTTEMESEDNE
jgi:DNA invertase Pin-like site-specific DNA recombinase